MEKTGVPVDKEALITILCPDKKRRPAVRISLILLLLLLTAVLAQTVFAVSLYESEDHFKQAPIFFLSIFPKEVKDQEVYYFNRALEYFTMREYELSNEKIDQLLKSYPQTKYKEHLKYLKADNEYFKVVKSKGKLFLPIIYSYQAALDEYPDSKYAPWAYFQIANSYSRMKHVYEASAKYQELMERYPKSIYFEAASIHKAELDYDAGKYNAIVSTLKGFSARYPDSKYLSIANFLLGDAYLHLGKKKEALKSFENVKGLEKTDPLKTLYYTKILIDSGERQNAIYNLTSIINYFPKFSNMKEVYRLLADTFLELKDYNNAVYYYFFITKKYPTSEEALQSRLKIAELGSLIDEKKYNLIMKSKDVDFVLDLKKVYIDVYKSNKKNKYGEKALYELGIMAIKQKNDLRTMKIFKKLYDEFPDGKFTKESHSRFIKYLNKLVKEYYKNSETKKIVSLYSMYKKELGEASGKETTEALFYIGKSLMDLKLYALAADVFNQIKMKDETYENKEVTYLCMLASYRSRDYTMTEQCADELIQKYKKSEYLDQAEYLRAKSVFYLGRYNGAIRLMEDYVSKKSNKTNYIAIAEGYADIAESYNRLGDVKNSSKYYKRIMGLANELKGDQKYNILKEYAILHLAEISYLSEDFDAAMKYYESYFKGREISAADDMHLFYLALSYRNDGDYEEAQRVLKILLENSSRGFYARSAKEEIKLVEFLAKHEDELP